MSPVETKRRAHTLRGRADVSGARVRVRAGGGVARRGVVRRELAARVHAARRPLLLQAARAAQPGGVLGPDAGARRHDGRLHARRTCRE